MKNPVDEYLDFVKEAAPSDLKPALRNAAVNVGTGLAIAGVPLLAAAGYNRAMRGSRMKSMMKFDPGLEDIRQQDPERFSQYFNSLHSMSPAYAADPVVASTYMRQMANYPSGAGKVLVEARSGMKPSPSGPLTDALQKMAPGVAKGVSEAYGKSPAPPGDSPDAARMKKNIEDYGLAMREQDVVSEAARRGLI